MIDLAELTRLNSLYANYKKVYRFRAVIDTCRELLEENKRLQEMAVRHLADYKYESNKLQDQLYEYSQKMLKLEAVARAAKTVDLYFKALCEQWAANDGRLVSDSGTVIDASKGVQELCERAAMEIRTSLAALEGKAST